MSAGTWEPSDSNRPETTNQGLTLVATWTTTETPGLSETLECGNGYCNRDAEVYVSVTVGRSPRILVVGGERGRTLMASPHTFGGRCMECAADAVQEAVEKLRAFAATFREETS